MKSTSASTSTGGSGELRPAWQQGGRAAAALLAVLVGTAWGQVRVPEYRFGVQVDLVSVFATVSDRSGKLVTGLGSDDFVVYDNGVPQQISQFSRDYIPLSVVILLDCSSSMRGKKLDNARKALDQFLKRLRPRDEAMLVTFQIRPRLVQGFTEDFDRIRRALRHLDGNGSTALYDAILAAVEDSASARNRRRSLLVISDGINNYGRARLQETIERLRTSGLELFAIGLESNYPEDMEERAVTRAVLEALTRSAGGEAFVTSEAHDLGRICGAISDRMHNQYAFAYYPPPSSDGKWRTVRIEPRLPGLRIVASKTGYFPAPPPPARP
jgi:VWFA-related protein